jgi:hypothetical protein
MVPERGCVRRPYVRDEPGEPDGDGEERKDGGLGVGAWPPIGAGGGAGTGSEVGATAGAGSKLGSAVSAAAGGGDKAGAQLGSAVAELAGEGGKVGPERAFKPGGGPKSGPGPAIEPGGGPKTGPGHAIEPGGGPKSGPGPAIEPGGGPKPGSGHGPPSGGLKGLGGGKVALAIVAVVVAGALGTGAVVLSSGGDDPRDEVATGGAPGDQGSDDQPDGAPVPGSGDKPQATTTTTAAAATTTTEGSGSGPAAPVIPAPGGEGTPPSSAPPSTAPTTTIPTGPAPEILRFTADWDNSQTVQCPRLTYATIFRWSAQNATSASLGPAAGGSTTTGLPASGSQILCAPMDEVWQLTATGAGGTDSATVRTPYLG